MEAFRAWMGIAHILALLVLVAVLVLGLIGQMTVQMALILGALAVAVLVD